MPGGAGGALTWPYEVWTLLDVGRGPLVLALDLALLWDFCRRQSRRREFA